MLTQSFADAVLEAEKIIAGAPHVTGEQDLAEGYDYLAGSIRASLQMAWAYQRDFPYFVQSTGPYTKLGLDNPDTLYFHSYLRDDAEYVVTGRRGSTTDLSFQVLNGDYSPVEVPGQPDRVRRPGDRDRRRTARSSCASARPATTRSRGYVPLGPGAAMLLVREVYSDWDRRAARHDHASTAPTGPGGAPPAPDARRAGEALPGGGQDPAVPAADVPGLPRVVLPEAAGQHDDRAAAPRPAGWPPSSPRPATSTWPTTRP